MNDFKDIIEDVNKSEIVSKKIIEKVIEKIGYEEWQDLYDEYNDTITTTGEVVITLRSLELENERLEHQIEKMKCCHSCESQAKRDFRTCHTCDENHSKWVFAEKG